MYWSSQNNIRIRHVLARLLFTLFSVASLIEYGFAVRPFAQMQGAGIAMKHRNNSNNAILICPSQILRPKGKIKG